MNIRAYASAAAVLAAAACAPYAGTSPAAPVAGSAAADLMDRNGTRMATATATQAGDGLRIQLTAVGLAPGTYGAHIHAVGRCDPPGFESAGPHWNPTTRQHGKDNPDGMHKGDLPNLMVGTDGRGSLEMRIANASLGGGAPQLLDEAGAAVVIHAGADDYRTDPSGNSGARIACGVLR